MKRIITLSMAAAENPTWETVQARIKWLMADKSKDYDDIVASRQRVYRQPGFVAAMSDIMALQDPEIRARNLLGPEEYGAITAPTLVLWTSDDPTADVTEGRRMASMIPGARFEVMPGCGHWPQYEDRQDVQPAAPRLPVGPMMSMEQRAGCRHRRGAGPVGLTLANILGLQGVRTLVVDERRHSHRLSARRRPRRRGAAHLPVDRSCRPRPAAHRAQPDPAVLRRQPPPACRNGAARRAFRLAETQRLRPTDWSTPNYCVGLDRFDHVQVALGPSDGKLHGDRRRCDGRVRRRTRRPCMRARYVVGCDGGRSATRRLMGVSFDGTTSSTRWLVVDCANDPLGHPNSEVGADPARPYVSISIAHGIRRFEFMIHGDESDEAGRGSGVRQADARAAGPASGARRHHPAPGLHPPLAHRGRIPQGHA